MSREIEQPQRLRLGARRSPLAVAQADWVADQLRALGHHVEVVGIVSQGDTDQRRLTEIGGTGIFAAAVRDALFDGSIDLAVHSLKDLPVAPIPGLTLIATPVREDARDVIVGLPIEQWTNETVIGTGSPRREFQLASLAASRGVHPSFVPVRGNVDTRVELVRSGHVQATVLAAAGLRRLGRLDTLPDGSCQVRGVAATIVPLADLLPAPGQGALGVECRSDFPSRGVLAGLDDADTRACVTAERTFLSTLEAGCLAPVAAYAEIVGLDQTGQPKLTLRVATARKGVHALVGALDSGSSLTDSSSGPATEADAVGASLARRCLVALEREQAEERTTK